MIRSSLVCALPALLIVLAILLPFQRKAFTIDDTLFLRQAEHVLHDPLHPTAFDIVWSEYPAPRPMSEIMPSGPVMAYLLVPCVLAGGREWIGHLVETLLFCAAIVATASLALRLGLAPVQAGIAAIWLAATPAAIAMAGTCMPDIPAMSFGVIAMERIVAWRETRKLAQSIAGALALALAALSRPHLLLLWGVAALLLAGDFPSRRRWIPLPRRLWLPLALMPPLVAATALITRPPGGSSGTFLGAARNFASLGHMASNLIAFSAHWTFVIPFAIPWLALHHRRMARSPVVWAAFGLSALILLKLKEPLFLLVAGAAGIGLGAVVEVLRDGWKRRDATRLGLGCWLLIAVPVAFYVHMPSKYQLASAPAAAILVAGALGTRSARTLRWAAGTIAAAGLVLGGLILKADADLAGLGRAACQELIVPNVAAGHTVWLAGHWGFQWYAEKAGARCLTITPPEPSSGDLAVSSQRAFGDVIEIIPGRKLIRRMESSGIGGRIMSRKLGAGFYSNGWGYLPWAWGNDVIDTYTLWRLE